MNQDKYKKMPYYMQIREALYNSIINGEYKAGERLPAEEKLAEKFGVSRLTVSKAIAELVSKEYVYRVQGSGTFVSKIRKEGTQKSIMGFSSSVTNKGFKVDTHVFEHKLVMPTKEIAEKLYIPLTQEVVKLKRLRIVNSEPIVLQETYLNASLCRGIMDIDFEKNSLYTVLKEKCKNSVQRAKDVIEAIGANEELSRILKTDMGFPILLSQRVSYIENDIPMELTYSWYRSDQYVLEVEYK